MALQPAALGLFRLNNTRLAYVPAALAKIRATRVRILVGGVDVTTRVRLGTLQIRDVINEEPTRAHWTMDGAPAPAVAQPVRITLNSDAPRLLFNGSIETVATTYEAAKANVVYPIGAIDDLATLLRRRPFGSYASVSASTIVADLVSKFAPGFTVTHVAAGLPPVSIDLDGSEGFDGALRQIANAIGGFYYVEDRDVHLFVGSEAGEAPDPVDGTKEPRYTPAIVRSVDLAQARTRVYGRGHGQELLVDVAAGETILPVAEPVWYGATGGRAIIGGMRIAYTGVYPGGPGSVVGPSVAPSVAPGLAPAPGAGLGVGTYQYAYTFGTATGESLPSPIGTIATIGAIPAPTQRTFIEPSGTSVSGDLHPGDQVAYWYSWSTATDPADFSQESALDLGRLFTVPVWAAFPSSGIAEAPRVYIYGSADTRVKWVKLWRSVNSGAAIPATGAGGSTYAYPNTHGTNEIIVTQAGALGSPVYAAGPALNQVNVTGIAQGPSGTSSRKLYRTTVGGAQLKLVAALGNNTATAYTDAIGDGALGANAPATDTSGLVQAAGSVLAGSPSILLASAGPFAAAGGWATVGSQAVRYTGVAGNAITGLPPSGIGALLNTARYGEHVDPLPAITGVSGVSTPLPSGVTISIWVQRDDPAAQADLGALDGSDGVYEYYVSDERRNETTIAALCDANLKLYARPVATVAYESRDVKTKAGRAVVVTLPGLGIAATLTIQEVTISEIDCYPGTPPRYAVGASTIRTSLEALLRSLVAEANP